MTVINIQFDPKKLQQKVFKLIFGSFGNQEYQTKNLIKSGHRAGKWFFQDGRQNDSQTLQMVIACLSFTPVK